MSLTWNANIAQRASDAAEAGVRDAVEYLLEQANRIVPLDEGTLKRSGTTAVDGTSGAIGYNTPYAVRQHEGVTHRFQGNGQAKWLETTVNRQGAQAASLAAARVRRTLGS